MVLDNLINGRRVNHLGEVLRLRAQDKKEDLLYRFLLDGDEQEACWSYGRLEREARKIAACLQKEGLTGQRAVLLYPPSLEYIAGFFGCLQGGVVAVPAYPPDLNRLERTLPRLLAIIEDCQAGAVLTTEPLLAIAEFLFTKAPQLKKLKWISTDQLGDGDANEWKEPRLTGESLAFLQYSSGSTGHPKGIMLSHKNLLHNLALIAQVSEQGAESHGVVWLPPYHDMGLIGGIIQPLYAGISCTLMSPLDFLKKPLRWLNAISKYKGTASAGPNFAFELCVRKAGKEDIRDLDLSTWEVVFYGAEPIHRETIEGFVKTFGPQGFRPEALYPCYGLAEGTLIVSGGGKRDLPIMAHFDKTALKTGQAIVAKEGPEAKPLIGCGKTLSDQKILIISPEFRLPCKDGEIGEIWVAGPSIAKGYWNKPRESHEAFGARLADTDEGPFLRTGDLGFMRDGELFFTGRLKDLLILRGQNHYPQDIELTVEKCHPALRPGCVAAFSVEEGREERLVVVQEVDLDPQSPSSSLEAENIIQAIRRAVGEAHELQVHAISLIKRGSIPKTSSGKIRRSACKNDFLTGELETVYSYRLRLGEEENAPVVPIVETEGARKEKFQPSLFTVQKWLMEQLSKRLGLSPREIDIRLPLTQYGLDSKDAVNLSGELEDLVGRPFPPTLLWKYPTIEQLSKFLASSEKS